MRVEIAKADARAIRCRRKFLGFYPGGFQDPDYLELERSYKESAHQAFDAVLGRRDFRRLIEAERFTEIAGHAVRIESRTNLLFSFEKMALRDAVRTPAGAETFALGLDRLLHGRGTLERRFESWIDAVGRLPRIQTRVLTWPVLTVFPFLAQPDVHIFLKPLTTRKAATAYGYDFVYTSKPAWPTYASILGFAERVERDVSDLAPKDRIDTQGYLWVLGSDEYE